MQEGESTPNEALTLLGNPEEIKLVRSDSTKLLKK
jgi:hypothetical protein